jgi:hypothetical protein
MRRSLLLCMLVGFVASAATVATAATAPPTGDGTLAVRNGAAELPAAVVSLDLTGAVVAQVDKGRISLTTVDGVDPVVTGDVVISRDTDGDGTANVYVGTNLKLRAVDGHYRIRIWGSGVDVNAVGQGKAKMMGDDGWYSFNGSDKMPLPLLPKTITIGS